MSTPVNTFFRLVSGMIETGLYVANTAFETMQSAVNGVTAEPKQPLPAEPQVGSPEDLDSAVAEFANRLTTIARFTPWEPVPIGNAIVRAAQHSFANFNPWDPRNVALPLKLGLSMASLATQQGLRGLATYKVLGISRFPSFVADTIEMYTDVAIFISLEYRELIDNLERRLAEAPDDAGTRIELGTTLTKLGLYDSAIEHLTKAAENPGRKGLALHELAVAHHRAGQLEQAARTGVDALIANPENQRALYWLWLTATRMGGYPEFVTAKHRMEVKAGYATPTVEFEDIAAKVGLDKISAGRGLAIFDYNNDGYMDVVVTATHGGVNLFRNNGDGTFTDVSVGSGLEYCVNSFAISVGDYNNDGYPDLYITRLGFFQGHCQLFRNNGDGTFTDVTKEAGVEVWGPTFAATWVDYDCDGHLDLFVCSNLGQLFDRKTPNRLFHNNGDGTFTDVTETCGLSTFWPTIGAAFGDYNDDGYPDLFLSNSLGRSQLYRNNGDGTFTDISSEAGVTSLCIGSVTFWCDYNNDGRLDIMQWSWSDHEDFIYSLRHGHGPPDGQPIRIYENNGDGTFKLRNWDIGLDGCWGSMSGNAGDFNNDGFIDIVLGNGSPRMDRLDPTILLEFDGKKFRNTTFAAGLPLYSKGHGATLADLFGDGRLSVLVAAGGAYPGDLLAMRVFYPKKLPGNYLNVRLVGVQSNRSAIGARVTVESGDLRQLREVSGGSNFGCMPLELHFGLGERKAIDKLEIRWPSGRRQSFEKLPANKTLEFTEGDASWVDVYARAKAAKPVLATRE
ncbi:MAG: FG-GAP-like repeat-containing protein [Bryobacteraceae bacterium]